MLLKCLDRRYRDVMPSRPLDDLGIGVWHESCLSVGMPTESTSEVEAAARKLLSQGVKESVLVKRGGKGSLLVTESQSTEQGIFKAEKVSEFTSSQAYTLLWLEELLGLHSRWPRSFPELGESVCFLNCEVAPNMCSHNLFLSPHFMQSRQPVQHDASYCLIWSKVVQNTLYWSIFERDADVVVMNLSCLPTGSWHYGRWWLLYRSLCCCPPRWTWRTRRYGFCRQVHIAFDSKTLYVLIHCTTCFQDGLATKFCWDLYMLAALLLSRYQQWWISLHYHCLFMARLVIFTGCDNKTKRGASNSCVSHVGGISLYLQHLQSSKTIWQWLEIKYVAAAAASLCVQRKGAMTSLPNRGEVDKMLK